MSTPIHDPQRLLLAYIARVEQSGLCGYPALETHLHQHAMALKEQAALEAREARAAAATQASERAGRPDQGQQPIAPSTPQCSEAARAESREGARPAPMAPKVVKPDAIAPAQTPLQAPSQPDVPGDSAPMTPAVTQHASRETAAAGSSPDPGGPARPDPSWPGPRRAPKPLPGGNGTGPRSEADPGGAKVHPPAPKPAAPVPSLLTEPQPQLELLLRFRERVQATGVCDHPALQQRMEEHLRHREQALRPVAPIETGNARLALERHRQDCIQQLQAALCLLAELRRPGTPSDPAIETTAAVFGELRLQLEDGLSSYGQPLDPPQRRLLQRLLQRAAGRERRLQRRLRRGAPSASLLSELRVLAQVLRSAALQWMPEAEMLLSEPFDLAHPPEPAQPLEGAMHAAASTPDPTEAAVAMGAPDRRRRLMPPRTWTVRNGIRPRSALQAVPPDRTAAAIDPLI